MTGISRDVSAAIARLCTVFRADISDDLIDGYAAAIAGIQERFVVQAADESIKQDKWLPKPAELAERANKLAWAANPHRAEPEHWRLDSYRCLKCRDTGLAEIWTLEAMRVARQVVTEGLPVESAKKATTCVLPCDCPVGDRYSHLGRRRDTDDLVRLKADVHVLVRYGGSWTDKTDGLLNWAREWKPSNYVHSFDAWNSRAG